MTLRDLVPMARARQRDNWQHTAWLSALLANCHRDTAKKKKPFVPNDFNPLVKPSKARPGAIVITKENIGDMRQAFAGFRKKGQ